MHAMVRSPAPLTSAYLGAPGLQKYHFNIPPQRTALAPDRDSSACQRAKGTHGYICLLFTPADTWPHA